MVSSNNQPEDRRFAGVINWCLCHPRWTLVLLTIGSMAPFFARPFEIDDPLFVWTAQQIHLHPGNPYGFYINWYDFAQPMWQVTQNPPLFSYYLAVAAAIFGWHEVGLHVASLLPVVAVVLGTHRLAGLFCRWPMFAALATLFVPGFILPGISVMCDMLMLAFWVWAVVLWVEGVRQDKLRKLAAAGMLAGLAVLTKYNGICLIPLLAACGWLVKRRFGLWMGCLLIPVAFLCVSEWLSYSLYGQPHFIASNQYSRLAQQTYAASKWTMLAHTLSFAGGCFAVGTFCLPLLWRKREFALLFIGALLVQTVNVMIHHADKINPWIGPGGEVQIMFWSIGGAGVLALALAEAWRRDPDSCLLAMWAAGIFAFSTFVYWTVNGRALLPLLPVAAILTTRRLEQKWPAWPAGATFALVASAALSLLTAQADFQMATAMRKDADQAVEKYHSGPGRLCYEGHWGFQYYMETGGATLVANPDVLNPGDVLVIPGRAVNYILPDPEKMTLHEVIASPVFPWLATWNPVIHAGFYSSMVWGPLPFAFGSTTPQKVYVYVEGKPAGPAR